jgi:hypothetical protein
MGGFTEIMGGFTEIMGGFTEITRAKLIAHAQKNTL